MKKNEITYFQSRSEYIEIVYCKDSRISFPKHNHVSTYTIVLVLDGSIELNRRNEQLICTSGDYFVIPPYEPHAVCSNENDYTALSVCIKKEFVNEYDVGTVLLALQELSDDLVRKKLLSIDQISILSEVIDLLYVSITRFTFQPNVAVDMAKNIFEKKPEIDLQIEQLSKQVFVSKYHLIREFREQIGLTPHRFQMQNRIRKAQHLLKSNATITEVALVTGFYDQSHFNRCFKQVVGLTPFQYLQACATLSDSYID